NSFVGLNMNDQLVVARILDRTAAKQCEGCATEANGNFRDAMTETLAGAEVKGNISPAPVIDFEFERDEGFYVGVGRDVRFAAIGGNAFVVDDALAVLPAHGVLQDFFGRGHLNGMQDFGLFVADGIGFEGDWRLHGGERKELEKMIGNHVAKSARGFVEGAAMFNANGFGGGDLDVVDVGAVPERFDDAVGKAKNQYILYGFFAEIVVDAVDLLLGENFF